MWWGVCSEVKNTIVANQVELGYYSSLEDRDSTIAALKVLIHIQLFV